MRFTNWLIRALDKASKFGTLVGAALCFAMMAVLTIDVILRATFNTAIYGAIELAVFALVLMAFFAQAEAFTAGRHITVDFFIQRAPAPVKTVIEFVTLTISLGIMVLMSIATMLSGLETIEEGEISFTLQLPVGYFKLAAGVGLILLTLAMLRRWLGLLVGARDGSGPPR
ncbi:MAG: TRAP transporter small permease [Alphaproteobacteria bacterium]